MNGIVSLEAGSDYISSNLLNVPPEIWAQIVKHIETAKALSHLSLTCKRIHDFVENDGFRIFIHYKFPSMRIRHSQAEDVPEPSLLIGKDLPQVQNQRKSPFWRDAAHGLTTLARNWDRKAFIASTIAPPSMISQNVKRQKAHPPPFGHAQTMGFVPVIDSYEAWYGGDWRSRKEVVAWGAGAKVVMRVKAMGDKAKDPKSGHMKCFNQHGQKYLWANYHERGALEGRDDITSLNLLSQQGPDQPEQVIVGRASGGLAHISLSSAKSQCRTLASFVTRGRSVRSSSVQVGTAPILAACLSDSTIALYPVSASLPNVIPIDEVSAIPKNRPGKIWSSKFLSNKRLAVGLGPSHEPVYMYHVGRGEITKERGHMFEAGAGNDAALDTVLDAGSGQLSSPTSVYCLAPVAPPSLAGGGEDDIFLSGAYNGLVRYSSHSPLLVYVLKPYSLHDLRSPHSRVTIFQDPVDTWSPIYSLMAIGGERFAAGGGRHSILKVFDLRMPGDNLYDIVDPDPGRPKKSNAPKSSKVQNGFENCTFHDSKFERRSWNVFLSHGNHQYGSGKFSDSPVYSLSRPSQSSPTFFAGIESTVLQFDMVSVMNRHPDPIFNNGPAQDEHDVERKWDPQGNILCLPLYEHSNGAVKLRKQQSVRETKINATSSPKPGWDERWIVD